MALEITLDHIDVHANSVLAEIPHVEAVIQRGVRIRVLSSIHTEEMKIIAQRKLEQAGIKVYSLTAEIEVDMMDYFTYFSRKLGSGKLFDENNKKISQSKKETPDQSISVKEKSLEMEEKTHEE